MSIASIVVGPNEILKLSFSPENGISYISVLLGEKVVKFTLSMSGKGICSGAYLYVGYECVGIKTSVIDSILSKYGSIYDIETRYNVAKVLDYNSEMLFEGVTRWVYGKIPDSPKNRIYRYGLQDFQDVNDLIHRMRYPNSA